MSAKKRTFRDVADCMEAAVKKRPEDCPDEDRTNSGDQIESQTR